MIAELQRYFTEPILMSEDEFKRTDLYKLLKIKYLEVKLLPRTLILDVNEAISVNTDFFFKLYEMFGFNDNLSLEETVLIFLRTKAKDFALALFLYEKTKDERLIPIILKNYNLFFSK
jgi:hypothetical protein